MKVDADYTPKPYEEWTKQDWPKTYRTPKYKNVFAICIAFAPPHPISKVMKSPSGTQISATPPRTGMPSAAVGKAVAESIRDMLDGAPGANPNRIHGRDRCRLRRLHWLGHL